MNDELSDHIVKRIERGRRCFLVHYQAFGIPWGAPIDGFISRLGDVNPSTADVQDVMIWYHLPFMCDVEIKLKGFDKVFLSSKEGLALLSTIAPFDDELAALWVLYV